MGKSVHIIAAAGAAALAASAAIAQAQQSGGTATYWMTAETSSGMTAMSSNPAALMRAMSGGAQPASSRLLQLQLGTGRRAAGEPNAEHIPPAALQAGASLPLVTPRSAPPGPASMGLPGGFERPKGRMLIYWGCGDRARTGQPAVIDFANLASGKVPPAFAALNLRGANPPAPGSSATYGEWPNQRSQASVPASGSLVGDHVVRGNYTPEIRFSLAQGQDFLAPVALTSSQPAAAGQIPLAWRPVAGAKAWFASTMGAADNGDFILWSSSETQALAMAMGHLAPDDIARLLQQKVLLPASATSCTVPAEVARAAPQSMLSLTAFGGEANFSHPVRPAKAAASWRPDWTVKFRTKSTYSGLLKMDMAAMMAGGDDSESADEAEARAPAPEKKGAEGLLRKGLGRLLGQ
jgi:hypothetical protein